MQHCNFIRSISSLSSMNIFTSRDTIVEMANSSNHIHVQEILGALIISKRC